MLLYVMRHGPAEDKSPTGRDADRALSEVGRSVVERAARALRAARGNDVPTVVSSPLVRARETAAIVASLAAAADVDVDVRGELAPGGGAHELARELAERGQDALLVGHQPDVEFLVRGLVAKPTSGAQATRTMPLGFRTAMIVALEHSDEAWQIGAILEIRTAERRLRNNLRNWTRRGVDVLQ